MRWREPRRRRFPASDFQFALAVRTKAICFKFVAPAVEHLPRLTTKSFSPRHAPAGIQEEEEVPAGGFCACVRLEEACCYLQNRTPV